MPKHLSFKNGFLFVVAQSLGQAVEYVRGCIYV